MRPNLLGATTRWLTGTLLLALPLGGLVGIGACSEEPIAVDTSNLNEWAIEHYIAQANSPDTVVARVDGDPITLLDVALCRRSFPALSETECVHKLADEHWLREQAEDSDLENPRIPFARRAAVAAALVRERVERTVEVTDAELDAFIQEPTVAVAFNRPELRRVVHLLVEGNSPASAELAARIRAEGDFGGGGTGGFQQVARRYREEAGQAGLRLRVESFVIQEHNDPPDITQTTIVVQPFADGAFAIEPGEISQPVATAFGYHIISVLEVFPAEQLSTEDARALARLELLSRRRTASTGQLIMDAQERYPTVLVEENLEFLRSEGDLIRRQSESIRTQASER
ncbi:MAG: peptidyl-prolyl cis-trans isomerase [Myxococcales bacterium]|nr:peptidyl-prolyl cis-trans isomerase [Myxococcales bacterium]